MIRCYGKIDILKMVECCYNCFSSVVILPTLCGSGGNSWLTVEVLTTPLISSDRSTPLFASQFYVRKGCLSSITGRGSADPLLAATPALGKRTQMSGLSTLEKSIKLARNTLLLLKYTLFSISGKWLRLC